MSDPTVEQMQNTIYALEEKVHRLQIEKYQQQLRYSADKTKLQRQIDKHNSWVLQRFPHNIGVYAVQDTDPVYLPEPDAVIEYINKIENKLSMYEPDWRKQ